MLDSIPTPRTYRARRQGMAVVFVLGMISIALAISFALMQTQGTATLVRVNATRNDQARQAALTGLSIAMQNMHTSGWAGVDSTLTGQLSSTDSYAVTFTTGDANLTSSHVDWAEYPYRVTLTATGYSADPNNSARRATHQARAVVQLIRRQLSSAPANWSAVQNRTVTQWGDFDVKLEIPVRIEGPVAFQGALKLSEHYPYKSKPFDGVIDEVAIFNKALTQTEIHDIYHAAIGAGSGSDALGIMVSAQGPVAWWRLNEAAGATTATDAVGSNHGIYRGSTSGATGAPNGVTNLAARFDGVNDYIDLGTMDVSGSALTILAWFQADDFDVTDGRILSKATSPNNEDHFWMLSTISSGGSKRLRFRLRTDDHTDALIASSGSLSAGAWVLAAAVYDGTTMKLYKNGVEVGSMAKSGALDTNATVPVYLGDNPPGSTRARYLRDLEAMRNAGLADHRPLSGPVDHPRSRSSAESLSLLEEDLNVSINDVAINNAAPVSHPGAVTTYQLYPGGKIYNAQTISSWSLSSTSLVPDPQSNPLGLFYHYGHLSLGDDVTIEGTLIVNGSGWWTSWADIDIQGENISIAPATIPPLDGSSQSVELPVVIVRDDLEIQDGSGSSIRGFVAVTDLFKVPSGASDTMLDFQGALITKKLEVLERTEWEQGEVWWRDKANDFLDHLSDTNPIVYFSSFLEAKEDLQVAPQIKIAPDPAGPAYHWHDWNGPLFVAHPNDAGLVWDLIEWTDNL